MLAGAGLDEVIVAADIGAIPPTGFDAFRSHQDLYALLGAEPNPIPVKWAVQQLGLMPGGIRLPLTPLSEANQGRVLTAMRLAGVIA